ncbi:Asp23/Gls24 family envelope stress response protein, partial [Streptomyces sp. NPDC059819]|uniref:Asp23/Gls24 family envelope stress response protein n=1 Tax=Streptomyces sp. NPDC059819 TaxID=3346963 RepID=UPI0036488BCE
GPPPRPRPPASGPARRPARAPAAGGGGGATPRSTVAVHGGSARLGLSLDLPYPIDLAEASRQVQRYVGERVAELTGMRVTEVTVSIQHLIPAGGLERSRVQ